MTSAPGSSVPVPGTVRRGVPGGSPGLAGRKLEGCRKGATRDPKNGDRAAHIVFPAEAANIS